MDFNKIAQAANDSTMKKEAEKNNARNAVKMIAQFPSEIEAIKNIVSQLVINSDAEIKPYGGKFPFYVVLKATKERPHWDDTYYESDYYYYIFNEDGVTRKCKYNTAVIAYSDVTREISNELEIPEMSIPYGDIPMVTRFSKRDISTSGMYSMLYRDGRECRSDIIAEYAKADGVFKSYMEDFKIISNKVDYLGGIGNTSGFIAEIKFYLEGNEDGERVLIKNEVLDKLDNDEFEIEFLNKYKKHILDGIANADIEESMEEILCDMYKNHSYLKNDDSLYLYFDIIYNEIYALSDDKPNVNIGFDTLELVFKGPYGDSGRTVGEIKSDNKIAIEMSDLFWKHHKTPATRSLDSYCDYNKGLNYLGYDDVLSDDDEEFCDDVCEAIAKRMSDAGLIVESHNCTWDDDSEYPTFNIKIKNPLKR